MIKQKRESLERFIVEQTLGPGAVGYRYIDLQGKDWEEKNLKKEKPIEYHDEIIDSVPAAYYSTGILFPLDTSNLIATKEISSGDKVGSEDEIEENTSVDIEDDPALSANQMYPTTMGMTFCISGETKKEDIQLFLEYRYYQKIEHSSIPNNIGLLIEGDARYFQSMIDEYELFREFFSIRFAQHNQFLILIKHTRESSRAIRDLLTDISKRLSEELGDARENKILSAYKKSVVNKFRGHNITEEERRAFYEKIRKIELFENFEVHIVNLLDISDTRSYGLWRGRLETKEIVIPAEVPSLIDKRKEILSYRKFKELEDIVCLEIGKKKGTEEFYKTALSINIQFSKHSKREDDRIFVKLQVVNTSNPYTKDEGDNRYYSAYNESVNARSFFGVRLIAKSPKLRAYNFEKYHRSEDGGYNEDEVTRFIYRSYEDYGTGHGCSVTWSEEGKEKIIKTEYIPSHETPDVDPVPRNKHKLYKPSGSNYHEPEKVFNDTTFLRFKWLSTLSSTSDDEVISGLKKLATAYDEWITERERQDYAPFVNDIAIQELKKCRLDKDRILRNIELLDADDRSLLKVFRLMNTAMFMQLWHSQKVRDEQVHNFMAEGFDGFFETFYKNKADDRLFDGEAAAWRPFQLAFILLNIDGIHKPNSEDEWFERNGLVDLVWFPTGGGKTEAYLGIIAFAIIYRRLIHGKTGGGTAVIMRYTLRLLTMQQFQRATLLIMALELIRRWGHYNLGPEPIYIGLWVGESSLPNKIDNLIDVFTKIQSKLDDIRFEDERKNLHFEKKSVAEKIKSAIPYNQCPWCGTSLYQGYKIDMIKIHERTNTYSHNRILLSCRNKKCSFNNPPKPLKRQDQGPIPASLCDEEIYQHPPSLLFGTVDKFAQLAHKVSGTDNGRLADTRRLFGRGNWEAGKPSGGYIPPDLIIQDELHLLMGPLGSAVALMECAIDQLCTRKEDGKWIRPKVISSTATTRNTALQIMALFNREVNLFPKPGVDCDDSFFAFYRRKFENENRPAWISKRKYLGFMPTGKTHIWMQLRLAAICLVHRAKFEIDQLDGQEMLSYEYQGSGLSKALDYYHTIISYFNSLKEVGKTESQIHTYLIKEIRRVFNRVLRPGNLMHAYYSENITKGELTGRLTGEEVKTELDKVEKRWQNEQRLEGVTPPDFVVATNMISVGIDIKRFNAMIVNSMPRNIAEYIQASSRVARDDLGLVLTLHHPYRARDISHYEKFIEFHEKFYGYVEPISITPFTSKALDRYLGLYLATILRHSDNRFTNRDDAKNIVELDNDQVADLITNLSNYFEDRRDSLQHNPRITILIKSLLRNEEVNEIKSWFREALQYWKERAQRIMANDEELVFNHPAPKARRVQKELYISINEYEENIENDKWLIPQSLRVIEPEAVVNIKQV